MNITPQKYAQGLYELTKNNDNQNEVNLILRKFVSVLNSNRDLLKIDLILEHFEKKYNKEAGILNVKVFSKFDLNDEIVGELKEYISQKTGFKNVNIKIEIDKSILGGIIIKYNDQVLDMSLNNTLKQLKRKMVE